MDWLGTVRHRSGPLDRCRGRTPRPSRPAARRRSAAFAACGLALLALACADKRISPAELAAHEQQLRDGGPPLPVDPAALALVDLKPYTLAPGDVVAVRLYGLSERDRYEPTVLQLRVQDDGRIHIPVAGPITVAGLTLRQVEQAILAAHVPAVVKDLAVFVELLETETTTVFVMGSVTNPGMVKLRSNERNVLYALSLAGGFGVTATAGGFSSANSGRVKVRRIRPELPDEHYNLNDLNDIRRALTAAALESGDVVEVEAAETSAVYVSGLVNRSGPILIPNASTLSVVRAVAAAGGLRDYLDVKEATLVRSLPDGRQVHVKLPLSGMLKGEEPDLALRAGDVLSIPYTLDSFAQEWFFRNMMPGPFNVSLHYDPLAQYNANRAIDESRRNGGLNSAVLQSLGSSIPSLFVPPTTAP